MATDVKKSLNLYELLGIPENADNKAIDRRLGPTLHKWHPDRNLGDPRAVKIFAEYSSYRDILKDPEQRREHDARIRRHEAAQRGEANKLLPRERLVTRSGFWRPAELTNAENNFGIQRQAAFKARKGEDKFYDIQIQTHRSSDVTRRNAQHRAEKVPQLLYVPSEVYELEAAERNRVQGSFMVGDDRAYMQEATQTSRRR